MVFNGRLVVLVHSVLGIHWSIVCVSRMRSMRHQPEHQPVKRARKSRPVRALGIYAIPVTLELAELLEIRAVLTVL